MNAIDERHWREENKENKEIMLGNNDTVQMLDASRILEQ